MCIVSWLYSIVYAVYGFSDLRAADRFLQMCIGIYL